MSQSQSNYLSDGKENDNGLEEESAAKLTSRPTIHWGPVLQTDVNGKEEINTNTDHFDALFARSNASTSHPRCYSSASPSTIPTLLTTDTSDPLSSTCQPLLSSKAKTSEELLAESSAQTKRKNFSLTHSGQTFLQASSSPNEQLEPLARSCSYKRPQSIKKYRQKKEQQALSSRKSSILTTSQSNHPPALGTGTPRISATELLTTDEPQDQWSSPKPRRSERLGSLPLDQLQLPSDGDQEIYLVRQFNTTSKGFVNRGDSFKRSIKRSGSNSRRSSFRGNAPALTDRPSSPEHDPGKEIRTSRNSLTNSSSVNPSVLSDETRTASPPTLPLENGSDDEEDAPVIEHIQTEDGRLQEVHIYQVYLLGMSGTGKCSLIRQFKSTEYRGIYEYSSSVDDDPDNTVSIMLDGVESRLHVINIDADYSKISVTGDAFIVVYSITDRQSFQTAVQLIKNLRDNERISTFSSLKRHVPLILVGNKSDLVRKRSVTKEIARHTALKHNCKFVETSAAINDKVDDLLVGTLNQIRINERLRTEQKRRLTLTNGSMDTNDSELAILSPSPRQSVFAKFLRVFRRKPSRLSSDVENLNSHD